MTTKALKEEISAMLEEVKDDALLHQFHQWLQINTQKTVVDWWEELSEEEKADLQQSKQEVMNDANLLDHDEVIKEALSWRKK